MGPPTWVLVLTAVLGSSVVSSLLTARATSQKSLSEGRRADQEADKADAEARRVISEASTALLEPLVQRVAVLEARLRATEGELVAARQLIDQLTGSLRVAQTETDVLRRQMAEMSSELAMGGSGGAEHQGTGGDHGGSV